MKNLLLKFIFTFLGRMLGALYREDYRVADIIGELGERCAVKVGVMGYRARMLIVVHKNDIEIINDADSDPECDVCITFKHINSALKVLTGRKSVTVAYAEKNFFVNGDLNKAMALMEVLEITESYLLPDKYTIKLLGYMPEKKISRIKILRKSLFKVYRKY